MNTKQITFIGCITLVATTLVVVGCNSGQSPDLKDAGLKNQQETKQISVKPTVNNWTSETTIGQIVAERPQTARVFDLVGIDYCCGGKTPLGKAADAQNIDAEHLISALSVVGIPSRDNEHRNWQQADIGELMNHIVDRHHTWLRRELPPLTETTKTVYQVHGDAHSELKEVAEIVERFGETILPHLDDEEQRVFPAVRKLAAGKSSDEAAALLDEMRTEHDALGKDLHRLRELTNGFTEPADACARYREMLGGLMSLERDMHTHVHLENNVLLPRALKLMATTNDQ